MITYRQDEYKAKLFSEGDGLTLLMTKYNSSSLTIYIVSTFTRTFCIVIEALTVCELNMPRWWIPICVFNKALIRSKRGAKKKKKCTEAHLGLSLMRWIPMYVINEAQIRSKKGCKKKCSEAHLGLSLICVSTFFSA